MQKSGAALRCPDLVKDNSYQNTMGYMVELNTLLGLPKAFDVKSLKLNQTYIITKERERAFPLLIAVLIVDSDWNFYGYCKVNSAMVTNNTYKTRFTEAGKMTGEVKA